MFITASVAFIGALITIWKYILQRKSESLIRAEENFNLVLNNLGSENKIIRANAAVSTITFMESKYSRFHEQLYNILLANLRIDKQCYDPIINQLLVKSFSKILRVCLSPRKKFKTGFDFSNAKMDGIDLSGLNLPWLCLVNTSLRHANLCGVDFFKARGYGVDFSKARLGKKGIKESILKYGRFQKSNCKKTNFRDANLIGVDFKYSDMEGAQFQKAKLQSAHFEYAKLNKAKFEQANLKDAYFKNACLDEIVLNSILNAKYWDKAYFSDEHKNRLYFLMKRKRNNLSE